MMGLWASMYPPEKRKLRRPIAWRRIAALFAPYVWQECVGVLCIFTIALLGLVPAYMVARIIDEAIRKGSMRDALVDVLTILVSALAGMGLTVLQSYLNSIVGEGIVRDLRTNLVSHLHKLPLAFFTRTKTGEIMNRASGDVETINNVLTSTLTNVLSNFATITTTLVWMFLWDWRLAILSMMVVPLMIIPLSSFGRKMYTVVLRTREQRDEIESIAQETLSISGITLIKSFAREAYERIRFRRVGTEIMNLQVQLGTIGRWFSSGIGAMTMIGPAIVWLAGSWLAIEHAIQIGVVVAFVQYIQGRLYGPASALAGIQVQVVGAAAVFERIFEYLDLTPEDYVPHRASELATVHGDIRFEDVSFAHGDRDVLKHIDFHVEAGQVAAFVGPSGGGKTTITQLVPRFYDPRAGRILLDGHDIRRVTLSSLRHAIGIVTQETYLFHDTIANNLRYARPDATDEELRAATAAAHIHDVIMSMPKGHDTIVGERGQRLSGGERQRLAIARVLLKDPRILIFDEATSSLDSHSEAAIQAALLRLMRGRTSLVIAHRLSTILSADVIFVVNEGRIVERGTHASLLVRDGPYAQLYRAQFGN